jgi:hypothetical protein
MSTIEGLTACVTSFERPERLAACLASIKAAGIENVSISNPTREGDYGCNNSWMVAAYGAKTKRILLIHDDDLLSPEFGLAYQQVIGPCLDKRDAGWASWNAELKFDDGTTAPAPYFAGASAVMPSRHFLDVIEQRGARTFSPCVSIFNRAVLIRACKEAGETLRSNGSLERPGMLLGTEILVYMRHCQTFKRWLHLDKVLSYYGHWSGSGTVIHQAHHTENVMVTGYDLARDQGRCKAPDPTPRIIFVHSVYEPNDAQTREKQRVAQESWKWHFASADFIDCPVSSTGLPKIGRILDAGCELALPEDIVVYCNADCGLATHAFERIVAGVERGRGVTCLGQHVLDPIPGRLYKDLTNLKQPGGIDAVAVTPQWWRLHRDKMPDMYIGREAWDSVFAVLAEEWADGRASGYSNFPDAWHPSRAHTANVVWHQDHFSPWQCDRMEPLNRSNRDLARAFFAERGNDHMVRVLK